VWLITLALFIKLFRKTFGFDDEHLPLRLFVAGSPFFVKNFMHTLGHFDIYGCAFAIALLLVPARSVGFVISAALASMILIHQIHVLMYVPTIAVTNLLSFSYIWYQPLGKEIGDTWDRMPSNLLGVPVFALLVWLHSPLWRYFVSLIRSLSDQFHRRVVIAGIVAVSLAYLILFAIVFDYSRWISNWAVCMLLMLHAVKNLPSTKPVPPISPKDRKTAILGWIVTLVPRVGIVRPF
jgi:hypothetical protein